MGPAIPRSVGAQGAGPQNKGVFDVAVITCCWRGRAPAPGAASASPPEWVTACLRACLQGWAQRVPGSFCGQTAQGMGLLLVPAYALARETAQALGALLDSTARAAGAFDGGWEVGVIGPLSHGSADQVSRQLAQAGWPLS